MYKNSSRENLLILSISGRQALTCLCDAPIYVLVIKNCRRKARAVQAIKDPECGQQQRKQQSNSVCAIRFFPLKHVEPIEAKVG